MPAFDVPQGWTPNKYWSAYAESFAQEGSDDQLIAALTGAVPEAWANRFMPNLTNGRVALRKEGSDEYDDEATRRFNEGIGKANSKFGGWQNANSESYIDSYSKAMQNRLRRDWKNSKGGLREQGIANLRDQGDEALKEELRDIDEQANARGLLHSGIRQGARARAAAQRSGELGQAVQEFDQGIGDMDRNINSDAFASEMTSAFNQADLNDITSQSLYRRMRDKIDTDKLSAQAAQKFGQAGGNVFGNFFSSGKK